MSESHKKKESGLEPVESYQVTRVTSNVMKELEQTSRLLITQKDSKNYTSREKQKVTVNFLATLLNQAEFRERYVEYAMNNPGEAMKHAIQTMPKELHVESHSYLENLHVLAPVQTVEQWQALVEEVRRVPTIEANVVSESDETT